MKRIVVRFLRLRLMVAVSLLLFVGGGVCSPGQAASEAAAESTRQTTDAAVHAMCKAQVALLGENPTHGYGDGLAFKAELVRRLVSECHFNALFFESGMYDYVNIQRALRAGQGVSDAMISAAIGGLWANQETQDLVPFLRERIRTGTLTLAGLDDQLGRGSYAVQGMAADLVKPLRGADRERCLAVLEKHTHWQYTDKDPYAPADKQRLLGCLDEIEAALESQAPRAVEGQESFAMVENLKRNLARDFTENDFAQKDQALRWVNDREFSMYENFCWSRSRLPAHSKIIVWAATVHTAKELENVPGLTGRIPLGFYLHRDFGKDSYSLGISARSGFFKFRQQPSQQLSVAPANSLEVTTLPEGAASVFVSGQVLKRLPPEPSRLLGSSFVAARWSDVFDGVVIFGQERPPVWLLP